MFDHWYEPEPPIMLGSAYSVSGDCVETSKRPIGFVWPKRDPQAIIQASTADILKYGQSDD